MITKEQSIPKKSKEYLSAQSVFYVQFNEIEFYVEDIDQENLYFVILKRIFPDIKFEKIFPLGGKQFVFQKADNHLGSKRKIFLVDLDWDDILGIMKVSPNLFYIKKYSIENYLLEINAIKEIIKEQRPKLKEVQINQVFKLNNFLKECLVMFPDLLCCYLVVQKFGLGIENVNSNIEKFIDFTTTPASLRTVNFNGYLKDAEVCLKAKNKKMKVQSQMKKLKKHFKTENDILKSVPGKYLLSFLKYRIENYFSLPKTNLESLAYRLSKNCELDELQFLKKEVSAYLASA